MGNLEEKNVLGTEGLSLKPERNKTNGRQQASTCWSLFVRDGWKPCGKRDHPHTKFLGTHSACICYVNLIISVNPQAFKNVLVCMMSYQVALMTAHL